MTYVVTSRGSDGHGRPGPAAIDLPSDGRRWTLEEALDHARELLRQGVPNVAIKNSEGHSIAGDELIACCVGKKKLTSDLRAV